MSLRRGETVSAANPKLQIYTQIDGILANAYSVEYRIYEAIGGISSTPTPITARTAATNISTGRYVAGWTVPASEALGLHQVRWYVVPVVGQPEQEFRDWFDVAEEALVVTAGGCEPGTEALPVSPASPSSLTEALGIHQSDVIIHSAIEQAIADIRANPVLLDYVFASLPRDSLTAPKYGQKEVDQAKKWFLATEIPVVMRNRLDEVKLPAISIGLLESSEAENTLADTHYIPQEEADVVWPVLAGPFSPVSYNQTTGVLVVPEAVGDALSITVDMVVVDRDGVTHAITEVTDAYTIVLAPGTIANFSSALIKTAQPQLITQLESLAFRETYSIGCHAQNEPVQLTYLHSIVTFILLRYKETLLEARGFERSTVSSAELRENDQFQPEMVWSRYINLTGYVRQYWPKTSAEKVREIVPEIIHQELEPQADVDSLLWHGGAVFSPNGDSATTKS